MFAETGLLGEMVTTLLRRRNESRPNQLLMPLHRMLEASVIAFSDALSGANSKLGK